jgi:hypothetical protein
MIAGGFAIALSALQFARFDVPYTIGAVFDVLPAALFLHVYLAFPDGYLTSWFERGLIAATYAAAIGLQFVKMSLALSALITCSRSGAAGRCGNR